MWIKLLFYYLTLATLLTPSQGHIPVFVTTPANTIELHCKLAETCVHDTIPICGRNNERKREFLDTCDLLEHVCDTSEMYTHIDDEEGCPKPKKLQIK